MSAFSADIALIAPLCIACKKFLPYRTAVKKLTAAIWMHALCLPTSHPTLPHNLPHNQKVLSQHIKRRRIKRQLVPMVILIVQFIRGQRHMISETKVHPTPTRSRCRSGGQDISPQRWISFPLGVWVSVPGLSPTLSIAEEAFTADWCFLAAAESAQASTPSLQHHPQASIAAKGAQMAVHATQQTSSITWKGKISSSLREVHISIALWPEVAQRAPKEKGCWGLSVLPPFPSVRVLF